MGITRESISSHQGMIPELKIEQTAALWEENDISFSECCCTCCVGIIDMVNSTRITAGLKRDQMNKYYCFFINWAAAIIRGYGGTVVKNTGDGLLFYFPSTGQSENVRTISDCLNCSIAMTRLHPSVNSKLSSESLPELNYRISLDYGEVSLARTIDSVGLDIFSTTVNICAKINSVAAPNTVVVGGDIYQISKNLADYKFQEIKKTISIADRPYPVYSVSEAKTVFHKTTSMERAQKPASLPGPDKMTDGVKV